MKNVIVATVCVAFSFSVYAQDNGWARVGAALDGLQQSRQDAYRRGVNEAATRAYLIESARGAHLENERLEAQMRWRIFLASMWSRIGLSQEEATAVASVYVLDNQQVAVNVRAAHERIDDLAKETWAAYRNYNYQLANQLLIAAQLSLTSTNSPTKTQSDTIRMPSYQMPSYQLPSYTPRAMQEPKPSTAKHP